jgi:hypothetical protein
MEKLCFVKVISLSAGLFFFWNKTIRQIEKFLHYHCAAPRIVAVAVMLRFSVVAIHQLSGT